MNYHLRLSGEPLMPPKDADFAFTIDFKKGVGNPRRVFDAASALIDAFEFIDDTLIDSIDSKMTPVMVLEDVEAGSLKVWLKNLLSRTEDEALKTLDWKPLIGRYLVKAKYLVLEFCDDSKGAPKISDLRNALQRLAQETDVKHVPDYAPIHEGRLVSALDRVQNAKKELSQGDKLTIEADGRTYEVNLESSWTPSEVIVPEGTRETNSPGEIILTIRKPDFIKDTMWQFSHGKNTLSAPIKDEEWLNSFHKRLIPLWPGDALRCSVTFTYTYDSKGSLIDSKIEINRVLEVIKGAGEQASFI